MSGLARDGIGRRRKEIEMRSRQAVLISDNGGGKRAFFHVLKTPVGPSFLRSRKLVFDLRQKGKVRNAPLFCCEIKAEGDHLERSVDYVVSRH